MTLPNASSLSWLDNGNNLLFSELAEGLHMLIVTTDRGTRSTPHRICVLLKLERGMAHHSRISHPMATRCWWSRWMLAACSSPAT